MSKKQGKVQARLGEPCRYDLGGDRIPLDELFGDSADNGRALMHGCEMQGDDFDGVSDLDFDADEEHTGTEVFRGQRTAGGNRGRGGMSRFR